jgi:hypothetical protein
MEAFSLWIKSYGIPYALYCDRKNAFVLTREPSDSELSGNMTGRDPQTIYDGRQIVQAPQTAPAVPGGSGIPRSAASPSSPRPL